MYAPVPPVPDFPALERRVLACWRAAGIFEQRRALNAGGPRWSFLDGPITANNPMGVHHAWGRSYKDMFQRYWAMRGRHLRYQNGFDCQGLWVEVEVEKELGLATKAAINDYGIDRFVIACKQRVLRYAARQTEQSIRLGFWMEWDDPATLRALADALGDGDRELTITTPRGAHVTGRASELIARLGDPEWGGSYFTFSTENNLAIWAFLKKCHERGFVYRGADVMPWCCRCGTGLSQMEIAEGRAITRHASVIIRLPLLDREREALLVWTTTPWTLLANVGAAVHPDLGYLKIRTPDGWTCYVGKENWTVARVQRLEAGGHSETHTLSTIETLVRAGGAVEVLGEVAGRELVGLRYRGPFDHLPAQQAAGGLTPVPLPNAPARSAVECHRVVAWTEVSGTEGTGIVHVAPGCGAEDAVLGRAEGLVSIAPLAEDGRYVAGFGAWTGRLVHEVADDVIADLKARGVLVAREGFPHVYPHCWRCKDELVFRLVEEWFLSMSWRAEIEALVGQIRWIPPDGEARERDWLRRMGDWMISKKRFWGLALPLWECRAPGCGWFDVIGSLDELRARAVAGWERLAGHTPHRPWVDEVELRCGRCGGPARRIADVGNPWLDAGIVPFSTMGYYADRAEWAQWYPAELVTECFPGQFRNWFYALLAMAAMTDGSPPFRTLLGHALVRDARGEEMHKSKGNAIAFDDAAETLGAEVMRYLFAAQNSVTNLNFPDLRRSGNEGQGARGKGLGAASGFGLRASDQEGACSTTKPEAWSLKPEGAPHASRLTPQLDDEVRRKLLTFWNCYGFFVLYAREDRYVPGPDDPPPGARTELDRWILSHLHRLIADARAAFEQYQLHVFMARFERFTDLLSNWYLRRSRRRFWKSAQDQDKRAAYATLYECLETLVRLLAPILPFLTEEIWANLVRRNQPEAPASVHLADYPAPDEARIDADLEARIDAIIKYKNLALSLRTQAKIKIRQPLARLLIRPTRGTPQEARALAEPALVEQLLDEVNVQTLELIEDEARLVRESVRPRFTSLGPKAGRLMPAVKRAFAGLEAAALRAAFEAGGTFPLAVEGGEVLLAPADCEFVLQGPEGLAVSASDGAFVALDTVLTPELLAAGVAREFIRHVQNQRKAADLAVTDRIVLTVCVAPGAVRNALETHRDHVAREVLARRFVFADAEPDGAVRVAVGDGEVAFALARAQG